MTVREIQFARVVIVAVLAINLTILQLQTHFSGEYTDLAVLYASGQGWNATGNPYSGIYGQVSLNPPPVALVLLGPLAYLSWPVAQIVWLLAGLVSVGLVARWTVTSLQLTWDRAVLGWGMALCTVGAQAVWQQGQLTWWLLPFTAAAWWAYHRHREIAAGLWLGVLITAKPFFALMPLALGWRTCVAAAGSSVALTLLSLLETGFEPWITYRVVGPAAHAVPPGPPSLNASLWSILAWHWPERAWSELPPIVLILIAVVGAVMLWASRARDRDLRWILAALSTIFIAPLGWAYYLLLFTPALLVLWVRGYWNWVCTFAVLAWWAPAYVTYAWRWYYTAALIVSWSALWLAGRSRSSEWSARGTPVS